MHGFLYDDYGHVKVYTDGSCFGNGTSAAVGGIGVAFGIDHFLNLSERLMDRATNNRAEITAAIRAIEIAMANGKWTRLKN